MQAPWLDKNQVDLLATCEFANRKKNVLFLGPPGVGKSHLAQGLGIRAIQNGFSVTFTTADHLIEKMRRDDQNPNRRPHRRKFMSAAVLIIDELGFQTLDRSDAHLLFKDISYRYERGATIITSNKSISQWPDMLAMDNGESLIGLQSFDFAKLGDGLFFGGLQFLGSLYVDARTRRAGGRRLAKRRTRSGKWLTLTSEQGVACCKLQAPQKVWRAP